MATFLLLRHAETPFHHDNRYAGRLDVGLTEHGLAQVAELAAWASTADIADVRSSRLARATSTAQPIAAAAGVELHVDERLRELDFGRGDGLTAEEMRQSFPEHRRLFELDPVRHPLPEGESPVEAMERFGTAVADAVAAHGASERLLVIVAHSTIIRMTVMRWSGAEPGRYRAEMPSFPPAGGVLVHGDGVRADSISIVPALRPGSELDDAAPWFTRSTDEEEKR